MFKSLMNATLFSTLLSVGLCHSPRRLSAVLRTEQKPAYSHAIQRVNFLSQRTFEGERCALCVQSNDSAFALRWEEFSGIQSGVFSGDVSQVHPVGLFRKVVGMNIFIELFLFGRYLEECAEGRGRKVSKREKCFYTVRGTVYKMFPTYKYTNGSNINKVL